MALVFDKYVDVDCRLGFWAISEDYDTLYSMVDLDEKEEKTLHSFKNTGRQLEWLSVRKLVRELTNGQQKIIYNGSRKPYLSDKTYHISISHSHGLSSVMISKNRKVGIDIEFMSHNIPRVAHKFINDKEVITHNPEIKNYHLYIHWCAKEAIYKICDKQDINFKENIFIEPFQLEEEGEIVALLDNLHGKEYFKLHYSKHGNYVVVWTIK